MDNVIKVIQVIAPLITVGLAILGLLAWYWQLVAKRKFEIAEQAVTVFRRANDALSYIRSAFVRGDEGDSISVPDSMTGAKKKNAGQYRHVFARLNSTTDDFEQVRLTQILVDLHISSSAAQSFDALFRVRQLVRIDAEALIEDFDENLPAQLNKEQNQRRIGYRRGIVERRTNGKPDEHDQYSRVLDEAQEVLETACRQLLRPKTLREFLFGSRIKPIPHEWSSEAKEVMGVRS